MKVSGGIIDDLKVLHGVVFVKENHGFLCQCKN
jgi:hypothetical protein